MDEELKTPPAMTEAVGPAIIRIADDRQLQAGDGRRVGASYRLSTTAKTATPSWRRAG